MDGAQTTVGVRAGEKLDLPDGCQVEVKSGAAELVFTHASGRKVFSWLVKPGRFKLSLTGPEPLPGEV